MKRQAMSALIVLLIIGSILSSCAAPTPTPTPTPGPPPNQEMVRIDLPAPVIPDQGTIGTEFTITGSGFGVSKPIVSIGEASCTVLEWTDTAISAVLADTIPAGTYDVSIKPGEGDATPILLQQAFTVVSPYIDPIEPMDIWGKDKLTIEGSFFGSNAGKVFVVDQNDQAQECQVLEWHMESITFALPEGLSEVYDIKVQNEVGSAAQTHALMAFAPMPGNGGVPPPTKTKDLVLNPQAVTSAGTGIFYGERFWGFYVGWGAEGSTLNHVVQYQRLGDAKWEDWGRVEPSGQRQFSYYSPSPVVFKETLYVFWVDKDTSLIKYAKYGGKDAQGKKDEWGALHTIEGATPAGEVSPVWNRERDRLELYYVSGSQVHWMQMHTTATGDAWSTPALIAGIKTDSPLAAEAVQTGENGVQIMLAVRSNDDTIEIVFTKDGKVTNDFFLINIHDETENEHTHYRPFLTNLGQGEVALLWRGTDDRVNVEYYSEEKKTFHDKDTWSEKYVWEKSEYPTGAVGFDVDNDDSRPATFWVFYGKQIGTATSICTRTYKYLGRWWQSTKPETYDWAQIADEEIWKLYPVIGVIDVPPFVKNANTKADQNASKVVFGHGEAKTTSLDISLKAGGYFTRETTLGLNAEVHAGVTAKWSTTKKLTKNISYELRASEDNNIVVLYLAPVFEMYKYQWYDWSGGKYRGTERVFVVPVVHDVSIIAKPVHPSTDENFQDPKFPLHEPGNLDTYGSSPAQSLREVSYSGSWYGHGATTITCTQEETKMGSVGGYFNFKIGARIMKYGFGAEGEFQIAHTTSMTVTDTVAVILDNPAPSVDSDVSFFMCTVFWTKPSNSGYWVPKDRRGFGDEPWFLTYSVSQVARQQS